MAITNEYPTGEVDVGTIQISAEVTASDYNDVFFMQSAYPVSQTWNPRIKLIVTIADNASYTDATVYESEYLTSGSVAEFQHFIQTPGTRYIKMETVDAESGTNDLLEYTIDVFQILYFLNEPNINTTGPKANKITVKSDTASATATTDPAPATEDVVHTIVTIDSGDATVCQEVANKLIAKWGSEQVSISGDVDLVVNIEFKKRVKIIAENIGINEFMMVQKKEHRVTDGITTVTVGDLQLSESELLARILDDLN